LYADFQPREARKRVARYLDFYNYHRPHLSLDYQARVEVYMQSYHNMQEEVAVSRELVTKMAVEMIS